LIACMCLMSLKPIELLSRTSFGVLHRSKERCFSCSSLRSPSRSLLFLLDRVWFMRRRWQDREENLLQDTSRDRNVSCNRREHKENWHEMLRGSASTEREGKVRITATLCIHFLSFSYSGLSSCSVSIWMSAGSILSGRYSVVQIYLKV
jgi:hypothetical protein